jgi:hypothetical protein
MLIFILNRNFLIEILMFRFENNNLKFKYQFVDQIIFLNLNKTFQNWNVKFHIQIIIFKIEMSIFRLN